MRIRTPGPVISSNLFEKLPMSNDNPPSFGLFPASTLETDEWIRYKSVQVGTAIEVAAYKR